MVSRRRFITGLAGGAVFGTTALSGSMTFARRYYDADTGQWVDDRTGTRIPIHKRKIPSKFKRRTMAVQTSQPPGTVIIHTDKKFLYLITGKNKAIRYGVGVGREGFGWNGEVSIRRKAEWPAWIPPKEMIDREKAEGRVLPARMEGGPKNPLGARAMYLYKGGRDTLYRIHGTNQPWSIGLNLSSGCIRMMNRDVEHLYDRVEVGTKVIVVGPGQSARRYINAPSNLLEMFTGSG